MLRKKQQITTSGATASSLQEPEVIVIDSSDDEDFIKPSKTEVNVEADDEFSKSKPVFHRRLTPTAVTKSPSPPPGPSTSLSIQANHNEAISHAESTSTSSNASADDNKLTPEQKVKLEKRLKKIVSVIEEYDAKEVNWDEEENSAYMLKSRLTNKLMEEYNRICKLAGYPCSTGRPTQKKFIIEKVSRFPEIDKAIEILLNSKVSKKNSIWQAPDYADVLQAVNSAVSQHHLVIIPSEVEEIATDLFRYTMKIVKGRRKIDYQLTLPIEDLSTLKDPADSDPELRRKLEENCKLRKSEADVIHEFAKLQENGKDFEEDGNNGDDEDENEEENYTELVNEETDHNENSNEVKSNGVASDDADTDDEDGPPLAKKSRTEISTT